MADPSTIRPPSRAGRSLGLALAAAILLPAIGGGCVGPLTMEVTALTDTGSCTYRLAPTGKLEVLTGGGRFEGEREKVVYDTRLDNAALDRLKRVITHSGFFFEDSPDGRPILAMSIYADIELGLMHNVLDVHGEKVPSLAKIVAEMNTHLPKPYQLPYSWEDAAGPDESADPSLSP